MSRSKHLPSVSVSCAGNGRSGRAEMPDRMDIGRRLRNDTERLEKLFELYTKMTKKGAA